MPKQYSDRQVETFGDEHPRHQAQQYKAAPAQNQKGQNQQKQPRMQMNQTGPGRKHETASNSMVNYHATEKAYKQPAGFNPPQVVSDDSSSLFFQHQPANPHILLSQGTNQIFFDSQALDKMPSQHPHNAGDNTTLNNPFSMEQPLMSTSEEQPSQPQQRVMDYNDQTEGTGEEESSLESDE